MRYSFDDNEYFDSICEMMEGLELLDQLSAGVVYSSVEPKTFTAKQYFRRNDITSLIEIVESRAKVVNNDDAHVQYKDGCNKNTLANDIELAIEKHTKVIVSQSKDIKYKSLTQSMIDEFRGRVD